jgi:RNA polymerase primary sigma factor
MYLREMGSVELLSREGEIAIAKRIQAAAGVDLGLSRPTHLQAIIIWRDELNEECFSATSSSGGDYAGPDTVKGMANPASPANRLPCPGSPALRWPRYPAPDDGRARDGRGRPRRRPPTPFRAAPPRPGNGAAVAGGEGEAAPVGEADLDDDDMENSLSLAAIEAGSSPRC